MQVLLAEKNYFPLSQAQNDAKKERIWRMCLLSLLWWCDEHPALVEGWGQLRDLQGLAPQPPSQGTP